MTFGPYGSFHPSSPFRKVAYASSSDGLLKAIQPSSTFAVQKNPDSACCARFHGLVVGQAKYVTGEPVPSDPANSYTNDRCFSERLGSTYGPTMYSGSVINRRQSAPYQFTRAESIASSSPCFSATYDRSYCGGALRQYNNRKLYKQARGHCLARPLQDSNISVGVICSTRYLPSSNSCSRGRQCFGRCSQQTPSSDP